MGCSVTFTCDACGATGQGVPGDHTHPDPPKGWVWFWGSPLAVAGPHACSVACWRKVSKSPDGKFYLPDSHERDADRKNRSMAHAQPEMWVTPKIVRPPAPDTVVYFIQRGESGPIKIGFSKNAAARLKQLQSSSPEPLRLLATQPGSAEDEKNLHAWFHRDRLKGEWFNPTRELLDLINGAEGQQ